MASLEKKIEQEHGRQLTNRQKTFARHVVEGIYSNAECARKAGFSAEAANVSASKLLNGRDYPHTYKNFEKKENGGMV
jgi:phage terminase small subunit